MRGIGLEEAGVPRKTPNEVVKMAVGDEGSRFNTVVAIALITTLLMVLLLQSGANSLIWNLAQVEIKYF